MYKKEKRKQCLAFLLALGLTAYQLPVTASAASGITPPGSKCRQRSTGKWIGR